MPAHQVPSKSNAVRPSYSRFIKWKGECTPLTTEKGGWRMRVTVSHLKIAANTHFSRFSHLHRVLERCDLVRPLGHVSPHMCSLHASLVRRSPAELHAILCVGGGTFCEPVNTLWSSSCCCAGSCDFLNFCVMHKVVPSMCSVSVVTLGWCVWVWKITHWKWVHLNIVV